MCIITRQGAAEYHRCRDNRLNRSSAGFTLPEVLVSLCIVCMILHGVWQWGIVMYRTSDAMAQNQTAVVLAQQVYAGVKPDCPEGWHIEVLSHPTGGILYETLVTVGVQNRSWQFYYAGPEEIVYESDDTAES